MFLYCAPKHDLDLVTKRLAVEKEKKTILLLLRRRSRPDGDPLQLTGR